MQINDGLSCSLQDCERNEPPSAVPGPHRFDRRADQRGKRLLIQTDGTPKVTQFGRHGPHDAIGTARRKATSGIYDR